MTAAPGQPPWPSAGDLLTPGAGRAAGVLDDASVLRALARVEEAWSQALVAAGAAPAEAALAQGELSDLLGVGDAATVAASAEASGTPVLPFVGLARRRLAASGRGAAATWLHRGLTSQDVLDTALCLGLRAASSRVLTDLRAQAVLLRDLAAAHRGSLVAARTLTQHAVPTTFGLVVTGWLDGVLDAERALRAADAALPVQVGGAGGTLSAVVELVRGAGAADPAAVALRAASDLADRLGLRAGSPWHVRRSPVTALADALTTCTDAWGHLAGDVLAGSGPQVRELREGAPGGSSTMPHKANPVVAALLRRAALTAPAQASLLHLAAASAVEQRSAGPWHAEWPALQVLARTAVTAAGQARDLLEGLVVDTDRMLENALAAAIDLLAEQRSLRAGLGLTAPSADAGPDGPDGSDGSEAELRRCLGAAGALVDAALARADDATRDAARDAAARAAGAPR